MGRAGITVERLLNESRFDHAQNVFALLLVAGATSAAIAADGPYRLIKEIPIGGPGGWDYISVDSQAHRLYVSHATKVVVVDIDAGKVIGEIPDTAGVHGFAMAPELSRGFSSNGRANTSTIVDLKTLMPLGTVMTEGNPDAIMYEPSRKEVYTFNGTGKSATVFDAQTGKVVATIPLGAKPEAAVADAAANRVFVNLEDTGSLGRDRHEDAPGRQHLEDRRLRGPNRPRLRREVASLVQRLRE